MNKKTFLVIWTSLLSSLPLFNSKSAANTDTQPQPYDNEETYVSTIVKADKKPDLFLQHAKDIYSDRMLFAGHTSYRSHSSHRSHTAHSSHYSSNTVPVSPAPAPAPSTPSLLPTAPKQSTYKLNITDIKMVQLSLNLLDYKAGKVDGIMRDEIREALKQFQNKEDIESTGVVNGQTCLSLARRIKEKMPDDPNANEINQYLLKLYLRIEIK